MTGSTGSTPKDTQGQHLTRELQHDPLSPEGIQETLDYLVRNVGFIMNSLAKTEMNVNFSAEFHSLRNMQAEAATIRNRVAAAAATIDGDVKLASHFPGEETSWTEDGKRLTPKQLAYLAALAVEAPTSKDASYNDVVHKLTVTPGYITYFSDRQKAAVEFREAMDRPCPRCGAASGRWCVSKNGKETTTHKARWS